MMNTTTIAGVFRDRSLTGQAADELRRAGFGDDRVRVISKNQGGFLSSLFPGRGGQEDVSADVLQGFSEDDTNFYQHELDNGSSLVLVQTQGDQQRAQEILSRFGAYNASHSPPPLGEQRVIQLRREELQVSKQVVQVGEVRIHKRVITENQTFTVPVTREELVIERLPGAGPIAPPVPVQITTQSAPPQPGAPVLPPPIQAGVAPVPPPPPPMQAGAPYAQAPFPPGQQVPTATSMEQAAEILQNGGSVRILVHEERVLIQKQPLVTEEVVIRKQAVQEVRQFNEEVRHEEARVERSGNVIVRGNALPEDAPTTNR